MKSLSKICAILVIIGGLNWGLIGFFGFDLVANLFGAGDAGAIGSRIIYSIVGLSSLSIIVSRIGKKNSNCECCSEHQQKESKE